MDENLLFSGEMWFYSAQTMEEIKRNRIFSRQKKQRNCPDVKPTKV